MKRKPLKAAAIMLSLIFILTTCILPFSATAASEQIDIVTILYPRGGGTNTWGCPTLTFMNGWRLDATDMFTVIAAGNKGMKIAYCVQPNVPLGTGDRSPEILPENFLDSYNNGALSPLDIQQIIGRLFQYGYTGVAKYDHSNAEISEIIATQLLVWETIVGERDWDFTKIVPPSGKNAVKESIKSNHPLRSEIFAHYSRIESSVMNHNRLPSFMKSNRTAALTHELAWDGTAYSVTLNDTNNVLTSFSFSSPTAGVSFVKNGNNLTISVSSPPSGGIEIRANKTGAKRNAITFWASDRIINQNQNQGVTMSGEEIEDPINGYVNVRVSTGHLRIVKTSEDGVISGIPFTVSGSGITRNVTTGSNGEILAENLQVGTYTVTEGAIDRYVPQTSKQITVLPGQTVTVNFSNTLKKFRVTVTKKDSEFAYPQGLAKLEGAVYGLYNGSELVDSYTTDPNGQFTTNYYPCGNNWSIKELLPSEGYLLDNTAYPIGAEAHLYTVENNTAPAITVPETVKKGKIQIVKHSDDGSTGIETPEAGATFEVFLEKAGSYEAARPAERDILIIDSDGLAVSKNLPYGIYRCHQLSGIPGVEKVKDFLVFVSEDGKIYTYIINNATITSKIKVEKRNTEDGALIMAAGIGFMLKNPDGSVVTQHIAYPTPTDISVFYTNSEGWLMLPQELTFGYGYQLIEVQTAPGFFLEDTPVRFDVTGETPFITVTKQNAPQKARIHISKNGEVFSSVVLTDGQYRPQYEVQGLAGAKYSIVADEDIYLNNRLMVAKNTKVATLTTTVTGATSPLLYLGRYRIVEELAPYGMTGTEETKYITLSYRGQTVEEYIESTSFLNERQRVKIDFSKVMEQDELFNMGMNGEIAAVRMGLYADTDITAADGKKIPKDGLVEIVSVDIATSHGEFTVDLPVGSHVYLKETTTDERYVVSNQKYPLVFEYAGQDVPFVELTANNGKPIENFIKRGHVEGLKLDEDGQGLAGALIGLFADGTTGYTEDSALLTSTSDENGAFSFDSLPLGNYICAEIAPPEAYVLSNEHFPITIAGDTEVVKIEIENRLIRGSVRTTKLDADYPDNKLSGAVFDIFTDTDGNKEFDPDMDTLSGTLDETEKGIYQLDGLVYSGYFLHERTAPDNFLPDENYYYFEILTDGEIVEIENQAGVGFLNQAVYGELWLTKKDVSDGKLIPNCGICIRDENGNAVVEGRTDGNGLVKFRLRAGKYTYSEFDCPGYILDESEFPFEITENGQIIKAEMTNEKIPEPEVPQTGDKNNLFLWLAVAGTATGVFVIGRRQRRKE